MKKKVNLAIERCLDCPHLTPDESGQSLDYCLEDPDKRKVIFTVTIPDWCPLEDE